MTGTTSTTAHLIHDLEVTRDATLAFFQLGERELEKTYATGKWSVKFLLHHLADSETVLNERIRRDDAYVRPERTRRMAVREGALLWIHRTWSRSAARLAVGREWWRGMDW